MRLIICSLSWKIDFPYRFRKFVRVSTVRVNVAQGSWCSTVTEKMQQLVEALRVASMETNY